jgi:serine/threonine protein kinase
MHRRPRKHYPGQFRAVYLDPQPLGKGNFGIVSGATEYSTDETKGCPATRRCITKWIRPISHLTEEQRKQYEQNGILPAPLSYEELREHALEEHARYKKAPHLHVKELVEQDGEFYFEMDKAPGEPLSDIIKKINSNKLKLSVQEYLRLCIAIANALEQQVHNENVIHRDIKPENIMVELSDPANPIVTFIDFGLAKDRMEDDSFKPCGTPGYAAPEVMRGLRSSEFSDVFSLGVTLAHLIGKPIKQIDFPI